MAGLRIVDVVPKHRWMVALDELPHVRVSVVEYFSPGVRIPLLNLPVEDRSEVVVIVVSAIMLAMVGLRRCSLEPHAVQIPFCIGVVCDVVRGSEVMFGMNDRGPARNVI